jgi:hypothetical protein
LKHLYVLLCIAAVSFAWIDDNGADSSIPAGMPPSGGDAISLTLLNTFTVPTASGILGLNMQYDSNQFGMVDHNTSYIRGINGTSGAEAWNIPINYSGAMNNFGTAHDWPPPYGWYLNGWSDSDMHYYSGSSWSVAFSNPAGISGRGMEYDVNSGYLWESNADNSLIRISSTGTGTEYLVSASGQMSGVATFYQGGDLWVVFTTYFDPTLYFYMFTGSALTYMGSAATGVSVSMSLGLTYSDARDTFFWGYQSGSAYYVAEFDYSLSALEQNTWGAIKAQF